MSVLYAEALERARKYGERYGLTFNEQLGAGQDGIVFSTTAQSAVKAFRFEQQYVRERDVYVRLLEHNVTHVAGFSVPQLHQIDNELWVLEMEIVSPPYILDFAGAYLDEVPPYANHKEIMSAWEAEKREQFEDHWPVVKQIMSEFRRFGIHLADVNPGNITFGNVD